MREALLRLVPVALLTVAGCTNSLNYAPPGGALGCSDPGAICSVGYDDVGDGGPALAASFVDPVGLAYDADGNLYVADRAQNRIRRIDAASGEITTIAGTGEESYAFVEGRDATETHASSPVAVAVTTDGTVFWTDEVSCVLYAISPTSGTVSIAAGGYCGFGTATTPDAAIFDFDSGSRLRAHGNDLLIPNTQQNQMRYWNRGAADVVVGGTTVPAGEILTVSNSQGVRDGAVASDGTLYVLEADYLDCRVKRYSPAAVLSAVVGSLLSDGAPCGQTGDGGAAVSAQTTYPGSLLLDEAADLLFVADDSGRVRAVNLSGSTTTYATVALGTGGIASIAGQDSYNWITLDGGPALAQEFRDAPGQLVFDPNGDVVIADSENGVLRRLNALDGTMSVIAGFAEQGTLAGYLNAPASLAVLPDGDVLVAGRSARVWRLSGGNREVFAGTGDAVFSGDGGPAANAGLWATSVTADENGRVFIADAVNHRVRIVDPLSGTISTVAGNGGGGSGGDGGLASSASFDGPYAVAIDSSGNLFIADDSRIRYVNFGLGPITVAGVVVLPQSIDTIAGGNGNSYSGDGGPALGAALNMSPYGEISNGMAVEGRTLYFADTYNNRIRAVDLDTGIIDTVVGSGAPGLDAVGFPVGIAIHDGFLYWAQEDGDVVKRLELGTGNVEVVAGDGNTGYFGEGVAASRSQLIEPQGLAIDGSGAIFVTDLSHRVRRIIP